MKVRGFTLIELLVSLAILAVLAAMAFPAAIVVERRHQEQELKLALRQIRSALDAYKAAADNGRIKPETQSGYPRSLSQLVDGVVTTDGSGHRYFLRRLPRDPFATATSSPEQSWGLRSYASPADQPKAGEDVFDVYSRSTALALDGSEYRQW